MVQTNRNTSGLVPFFKGETARQRNGGLKKTAKKTLGCNISRGRMSKCKHCRVRCPMKVPNLAKDKESFCTVPEARAYAKLYGKPIMNAELLEMMSFTMINDIATLYKTLGDSEKKINSIVKLHSCLLNHKQSFEDCRKVKEGTTDTATRIIDAMFKEIKKEDDENDTDGNVSVEQSDSVEDLPTAR